MNSKCVFVIGSDGYIGNALVQRLLFEGYKVVGIDNFQKVKDVEEMKTFSAMELLPHAEKVSYFRRVGDFYFYELSIDKAYKYFSEIVNEHRPSTIVNLAQNPSAPFSLKSREHAIEVSNNNLNGTINVLYAIKNIVPKCHLIQIGSMGEYNPAMGVPIPEGKFDMVYKGKIVKDVIFPRQPGSFYHACYDEKTELLTENGWKFFKDLNKNEKVATFNKDKDILEYQIPINYFKYYYDDLMVSIKNRSIDLLVTPNHKIFEYSNTTSDIKNWRLTEASKIYNKSRCMRRSIGNWVGNDIEYFILPSCKVKTSKNSHKIEEEKKIPMKSWLKFFGWFITEGFVYDNRVIICQDKEYNHDEIIKSFKDLNLNRKIQFNYTNGKLKSFSIKSVQLSSYLKKFGLSSEKYIPKFIKNLKKEELKILFDIMMKGDGYVSDTSKKYRGMYYSKSKRLANDVQEIAIKCGYATVFNEVRENEYTVSISENKCSQIILSQSAIKNRKNSPYDVKKYKGYVYCCEVPNDILVIRRNGKVVLCGNSKVASTYYIDCACRWWGLNATDIMQGVVYGNWTPEIEETKINSPLYSDEAFGTVVNRFIVQTVLGHPMTIYGVGDHSRGFLSLSDSIQCLMLAVKNPSDGYNTWNQLDSVYTMNELANEVGNVASKLGLSWDVLYIESPRAENTKWFEYNPVVEKLKNLGFKPTRKINEEIEWVIKELIKVKDNIYPLIDGLIPKITWK